jgi:preprotein translocase SecE subunit
VAKTIGKEKSSLARTRAGATAEDVSVDDTSTDEPRNEDMVVADESELNDPSIVEDDDRELALPASTTVARKTSGSRAVTLPAWVSRYSAPRFVGESAIELWKNVTWPTRAEAWNMTLIVIAMSAFIAVILGVADLGLIHVLQWIVSLGSK